MKGKSFKDSIESNLNPALNYISIPETEPARTSDTDIHFDEPTEPHKPSSGYKLDPRYVETKTRRVNILLQPSLYERIKAEAVRRGVSVNEYINSTLNEAVPN